MAARFGFVLNHLFKNPLLKLANAAKEKGPEKGSF